MSWNWSTAEGALGALLGARVEPGASERCASEHERELIEISASYDELDSVVRSAGPAVLRAGSGWVALASAGPFRARILTPRGARSLPRATLRRALESQLRQADGGGVDARVADALALLPEHLARNERVREAFASRWATGIRFDVGFLVRPAPSRSPVRLAPEVRLLRSTVGVAILQMLRFALVLGSWAIVGRGALSGRMDTLTFLAWVGVLLSALPMRGMLGALTGELRVGLGVLLEQRLFAGVLGIDPDDIRSDGIGRMIGRVHEAREWQRHTIAATIGATASSVDFALAAISLYGGGGPALVGLLAVWLVLSLVGGGYAIYQVEIALARARLGLTADLVERFVGQRTRLVQEPLSSRFVAEDRALVEYSAAVERRDRRLATLAVAATHGWRLVALAAAAERVLVGVDAQPLALIVGGMLFGDAAFAGLFGVARSLAAARSSWETIGHLYRSAERLPARAAMPPSGPATLTLRGVGFRYPGSERWTFRGLDWRVAPGDRFLLSGSSGAGKSTLAALLAGLRAPSEGVLLLDGLDLPSVGVRTWRRRVVCVPQFHQNHVFSDTFGFNVLMGAGWPPTRRELRQAGELCAELGLGGLLNSMPSGVSQAVGDSGWQLSHGERARLYLARALAQQPSVIVADESFGALDPITLDWVLEALERRAIALVVIAHP